MGFHFRRSVRVLPGIRGNLGRRRASVSVAVRGAHVTVGPSGTRTTVGLPGSGLSDTHLELSGRAPQPAPPAPGGRRVLVRMLLVARCAAAYAATR
jgi:hypothetical protein